MDKEEIVERLEKLEEEKDKLEEKYEKVNQENQRLREIIEEKTETNKSAQSSGQNVSRRQFLKKMGAGAIGLGALGIAPAASKLKLTKNGVFKDGQEAFLGVTSSQTLNADLDLSGYSLTDSTQDFIDLTGDGNDVRISTGQSIEDGSGTGRLFLKSNRTRVLNDSGTPSFVAASGTSNAIHASSTTPATIYDREGGYTALKYNTASSAPGTLDFPNATIKLRQGGGEAIRWPDQGGGSEPAFNCTTTGELEALDDEGNRTTLT